MFSVFVYFNEYFKFQEMMKTFPEKKIQNLLAQDENFILDDIAELQKQTPLGVAIEQNLPEFVVYLLNECKADPNQV